MHTKKSQLILYNLSTAYMSGGLMLFFNLNDYTKFDIHVSSICLISQFGGFLYCYPYVFSLKYVYEHFLVPTYYVDTKCRIPYNMCFNMLELRLVSVTLV